MSGYVQQCQSLTARRDDRVAMSVEEYRVDPARINDFVWAMDDLSAERRRDGAYAWGLFEDAAEPGRFLEYFLVESWLEHQRQHERVTHADADGWRTGAVCAALDCAITPSVRRRCDYEDRNWMSCSACMLAPASQSAFANSERGVSRRGFGREPPMMPRCRQGAGKQLSAGVAGRTEQEEVNLMEDLASRSAQEVFDNHLDLAQQGRFEEDITRNCSANCVILTNRGAFRGHEGVRELAAMLQREILDADYRYINRLVDGRFALLEWTADCGAVAVHDGADSFVIEDGKIVAQTIHYTLSVRDPETLR